MRRFAATLASFVCVLAACAPGGLAAPRQPRCLSFPVASRASLRSGTVRAWVGQVLPLALGGPAQVGPMGFPYLVPARSSNRRALAPVAVCDDGAVFSGPVYWALFRAVRPGVSTVTVPLSPLWRSNRFGYADFRATVIVARFVPPPTVTVPDVTRFDLSSAYDALHNAGLGVSTDRAFGPSFAGGVQFWVAATSPPAGARVPRGGPVTLRTSTGLGVAGSRVTLAPETFIRMPRLIGERVSAALAWAAARGFTWQFRLPPLVAGRAPHLLSNFRVSRQAPVPRTVVNPVATPLTLDAVQAPR